MKTIYNIVCLDCGVISDIISFPVVNECDKMIVQQNAEDYFVKLISDKAKEAYEIDDEPIFDSVDEFIDSCKCEGRFYDGDREWLLCVSTQIISYDHVAEPFKN